MANSKGSSPKHQKGAERSLDHFTVQALSTNQQDELIRDFPSINNEDPNFDVFAPFEEEAPTAMQAFRMTGLVVVKWIPDEEGGHYEPESNAFIRRYVLNYVCIFVIIGSCSLGYFFSDSYSPQDSKMGLIFCVALLCPSLQTYSLKLMFVTLPSVLPDIDRLNYFTRHHRPNINRMIDVLTLGIDKSDGKKQQTCFKEKVYWLIPIGCIYFSLSVLFVCLILGYCLTISLEKIVSEIPSFVMLVTLSCTPIVHSTFILFTMGWLKSVYISMHDKLQIFGNLLATESKEIFKNQSIHEIDHDLELLHKINYKIRDGFMKYLLSLSLITYLTVSLTCCVRILNDYENSADLIPLVQCLYSTGILGHQADRTVEQVSVINYYQMSFTKT